MASAAGLTSAPDVTFGSSSISSVVAVTTSSALGSDASTVASNAASASNPSVDADVESPEDTADLLSLRCDARPRSAGVGGRLDVPDYGLHRRCRTSGIVSQS
ncbi:hypothetical protein ACG96_11200 [Rhodococcoides fascians]|nr:hypothetical protein ACG96_11200 [Rhodococcus fascians]